MNDRINKLSQLFLKFPGIGERQARRFAFFILSQKSEYVKELTEEMKKVREDIKECPKCFRLYSGENNFCDICADKKRDNSKIIVVEKQADIEAIERTTYNGLFFILNGLIPIIEKKIVAKTRLERLNERIKDDNALKEVILAFPLTPNGDHTDSFLKEHIKELNPNLSTTSLGRGLSMGSEIEYIDPKTLEISLKKRE